MFLKLCPLLFTYDSQSKPTIDSIPLELSKVSRSWSRAKDITTLWGTLWITETTDIQLLSTWIRRAGQSDLDIHISFGRAATDVHLSNSAGRDSPAKFVDIMDILKPVSINWRCLELFGPHYFDVLLKSDLVSTLPVPRLTHFSIKLDDPPLSLQSAEPSADSIFHSDLYLTTVHILGYPIDWDFFPFRTITTLTLGPFPATSVLHWNTFAQAMAESPNLVSIGFVAALPSIAAGPAGYLRLDLPAAKNLSLRFVPVDELTHLLQFLHIPQLESLALCLVSSIGGDQELVHCVNSLPISFPNITTLSIESIILLDTPQQAISPFFTHFSQLTTLRLNFGPGLPISFWHALVSHANNPNALPRLQNLAFIDTPLLSVQELVLLREMAGQPVCELSLHFSNSFFGDFHSLRSSSSMTWLTDHTRWFFLTEGDRVPWVQAGFEHTFDSRHILSQYEYIQR
jgi:hypothetical protein